MQYSAALRFFFVKTLKRHYLLESIPLPKEAADTPTVLSQGEVTTLIESASNLMHRAILMTLYAKRARAGRQLLSKGPRVIPAASMYTPTMCPSGLMPFATVEIAPGTSNGTGHYRRLHTRSNAPV